jgi:hypothetical protein
MAAARMSALHHGGTGILSRRLECGGCDPYPDAAVGVPFGTRAVAMETIEFADGAIEVDATIIAEGLGIDPATVHDRLRAGKITARHERGIAEDEGRHRLSFFAGHRRFQIVV